MHLFDNSSTNAHPYPCWLPVYQEIYDGPPPEGVTDWDQECIDGLVGELEERKNSGGEIMASSLTSMFTGDDNHVENSNSSAETGNNVLIVPAILVLCVSLALVIATRLRSRRKQMTKTREKTWGIDKDGAGALSSRETSPDAFIPSPATAWTESVASVGDVDCSDPNRMFMDVEVDDMEQRLRAPGVVHP